MYVYKLIITVHWGINRRSITNIFNLVVPSNILFLLKWQTKYNRYYVGIHSSYYLKMNLTYSSTYTITL